MSTRRDFLKQVGVLAGAAAVPGVMSAMASDRKPNSYTRLKNTRIGLNGGHIAIDSTDP